MNEVPVVKAGEHPLAAELHQKVADLYMALQNSLPEFPSLLRTIHKHTQDAELCTVLSEEEIAIIVKGYEKQAQVTIVSEAQAKVKKIKAKDISADMI